MKILFIGGTGRLSKDSVGCALDNGYEVYCITRGSTEHRINLNARVKYIFANIVEEEKIKNLLNGVEFDAIIDFISFNSKNIKYKLELFKGKYKQYIFISSATVYNPTDDFHCESDIYQANPEWDYIKGKIECEKEIRNYFECTDNYYTIVRPYVTYGNSRIPYLIAPRNSLHEWSLVKRIMDEQEIPVFDISNRITLTHSKDFARGLIGLVNNSKAFNQSYHITSDDVVTWEKVLDICASQLGKTVRKKLVSVEEFIKLFPEYKQLLLNDKLNTWLFTNDKLKEVVPNFKCGISLEMGLKDMLGYYAINKDVQLVDEFWEQRIEQLCSGL